MFSTISALESFSLATVAACLGVQAAEKMVHPRFLRAAVLRR